MLAQASLLKNLASMRRFCKEHGLFPLPECLQVAGDTRTVSTQSAPDLQHVPDGADSHDIRTEFSSFSGRSSQQRLQGLPKSAQVTGCQTICGHVIKNPKPTGASTKSSQRWGGTVQLSPTAFHLRLPEMVTGAALVRESEPSIDKERFPRNNASKMHKPGGSCTRPRWAHPASARSHLHTGHTRHNQLIAGTFAISKTYTT